VNADNINQILDALAQRFGSTGAHLWSVVVRQQIISAWYNVALWLVFLIATPIAVRWLWRRADEREDREGAYDEGAVALRVAAVIAGIIGVGVVLFALPLERLLNPEYAALADIMKMLTGVR